MTGKAFSDNQTDTVTPVNTDSTSLPFHIEVKLADFSLPNGVHSGVYARYKGQWLIFAGRTNGMHTFNNNNDNFPPQAQNLTVYVVNPKTKQVYSRALSEDSGLTQYQIDCLSVTSPQYHQLGKKLYITGGYGVNTATGLFETKPVLTSVDIPGMIDWVLKPNKTVRANKFVRQFFHPYFQVTGGEMTQIGDNPMLLIYGQDFQGYYLPDSNGSYTQQVRRFRIKETKNSLKVTFLPAIPKSQDPNLRRRDLNICPIISKSGNKIQQSLVAFSGVFTLTDGAWTVPVAISAKGKSFMPNPADESTFKQAMNNYVSATVGIYTSKHSDMYTIFFGGITFGFFQNGQFMTDSELPFTNEITAVKIDKKGTYSQYLLPVEYPVIVSTASNPGNQLLFGAGAFFIPSENAPMYENEVVKFDKIHHPQTIGYIVGGIQSTLPNTNVGSDSAASPYIFEVTVIPHK